MYREALFEAKQVTIEAHGDGEACRVRATDASWAPFAEVLTLLLSFAVEPPVPLASLRVPNVVLSRADAAISPSLRAFWERELDWTEDDGPIAWWAFLRPGNDDGALLPDLALWRWLRRAREGHAAWRRSHAVAERWADRHRAVQARVEAQPRTIDWSTGHPRTRFVPWVTGLPGSPAPDLLAGLEARAADLDRTEGGEAGNGLERQGLLLALAAAGLLDPPDGGMRDAALTRAPTLRSWRRAAGAWREAAELVPGVRPEGLDHPLASPVALDWFRPEPFAGEEQGPLAWLQDRLAAFLATDHETAGGDDASGRWRPGVTGLQQLCAAGRRESAWPWATRCATRSTACTTAGFPAAGAWLAARLAVAEPDDGRGWRALALALGELAVSTSPHPLTLAGRPLDRSGCAAAAAACWRVAVSAQPSLRGDPAREALHLELEDRRWRADPPPVPAEQLPSALLDDLSPTRRAAALAPLPGPLRRYVTNDGEEGPTASSGSPFPRRVSAG